MGRAPKHAGVQVPSTRPITPERAVTFSVGGRVCALPLDVVLEVQQIVQFAPLPAADPAVLGLLDVRGTVMPAFDLGQLLGLGAVPRTLETPMLVCRLRNGSACLVVDGVRDVVELASSCVHSTAELGDLADGILGTCQVGDELVLLLDPERVVPEEFGSAHADSEAPADSRASSAVGRR